MLILKSCDGLEKYTKSLKIIAQNLQKSADAIIQHTIDGDINNQELNQELWHGLNNIEHQLTQFSHYTDSSFKDFCKSSEALIKLLRSVRPL